MPWAKSRYPVILHVYTFTPSSDPFRFYQLSFFIAKEKHSKNHEDENHKNIIYIIL
jgi:hypothetical protein